MIIYKITNLINNKVYIGQTTRPLSSRWNRHLRDSVKLDYPLYRAMRKYGAENFYIEEIDKTNTKEELNKKETEWIINYGSMCDNKGYNSKSTDVRLETSRETKDKIGKKSKENWQNLEYRKKISNSQKTHYQNNSRAAEHSLRMKKLWKDNEYLTKALNSRKDREKNSISQGGAEFKVYRIVEYMGSLKNGNYNILKADFIGTWINQVQCGEYLKIDRRNISACLNGKIKQTHGYIFEKVKGE